MREAVPRDDERPADVVAVVPVGGGSPGDLDAEFTAFMAEHADTLLHTAWLLVGNMDRAEELTQQALVRTYGAWRRARTDPLPYARRVLVNLRVDTWRRHRREVLTDEVPESGTDATGHARAEDRDQLTRALALLTPRQRRVVVLRYLADLSEADVAADLGVTPGTVKTTASRGLATLRAALRVPDEPAAGARRTPGRCPMTEDFAETLRRLDRYPGRGDRLDPTVVVRAGRRRLRTRRLGAVTGAGALVVALALLVGRPTSVPPVGGTPPALTQAPRPAGPGQSAVLSDDIQAVNVPATTSDGALVAGDVAGWSLSATPGTRDLLHWGWPGLRVSWNRTVTGGSGGAEWTVVDGAPTLTRLSTGQADDSGANAVVVSGAVPSAIPDPEVVLTSAAGFDLGTRGAVTTVEVPTFATADGRLLYAVVLRGAAATRFTGAAWQVLVVGSDGKPVVAGCDAAPCNVAPLTSSGLAGVPQAPITRFSPAPAASSTAPPAPTPPTDAPPDAPAPRPAQLAVGAEAAMGLSSPAGDLATVDASSTGEYYLAGDLGGASVRVGVTTSGPAPQITVFAVSGTATTLSPATPLTWAPVTETIPQSWARFPDDKARGFTAGITPTGAPRVFLVATWGFGLPNGSHVHALEVPTFAPPDTLRAVLKPDQRLWVTSDAGAPSTVGSGWSGYVYAANDGTILDPSCLDAPGSADACARQDLDFGAYDEIRAMLTK